MDEKEIKKKASDISKFLQDEKSLKEFFNAENLEKARELLSEHGIIFTNKETEKFARMVVKVSNFKSKNIDQLKILEENLVNISGGATSESTLDKIFSFNAILKIMGTVAIVVGGIALTDKIYADYYYHDKNKEGYLRKIPFLKKIKSPKSENNGDAPT
ncbi:MAG: hypothetical protein RsTaC01_1037 [Candidatus Paraimprobicoccus trichonymphae]|uniref:Uncharacterized protein n=1 Tax=Candidatus Paraimprobicoccus trichonymphae TaxID=3033793 RepID=A0AA48I0D1_9FIRM|nr:MAG: hypothetical protein RsTaC01_1037 [Candidatus Paraimprobicoccus trichonymphae]